MQKIYNKDGFNWWIGVVEDRLDPEQLGRCRVRIFGYHTDSKELLPTVDLPWAVPIQPITSAATSGVGSSPLGPLEGTWVMGFFLDGEDCQQPAMLGTFATKAAPEGFKQTEDLPNNRNTNDGILKDSNGEDVVDPEGNPVKAGVPSTPGWKLGQTSAANESNNNPAAINNYRTSNDRGGASYGKYQFASFLPPVKPDGTARPSPVGSPVLQYIKSSRFKKEFEGLEPATNEFDNKWKQVAAAHTAEFDEDQHNYVKRKYYNVYIASCQRKGLDLTIYGPGVQDLVWSTAVQFGPEATYIFTTPLQGKSNLSDKDVVNLVSEYKIANATTLFKSSGTAIQNSVRNRFAREQTDCVKLCTA